MISYTRLNTSTRRKFLKSAGAVSATGLFAACSNGLRPGGFGFEPNPAQGSGLGQAPELAPRMMPGAVDGRILVVVNMDGGNDGPSMVVPAGDPAYYDLRPTLAIDSAEVIALDDRIGLAPGLAPLAGRAVATIEGVGPIGGDLSHFSMSKRWEQGDASGAAHLRTGFLGRLADALDDGSPLVGIATGGTSPTMVAAHASTMSLSDPDQLWFLQDDWDQVIAYQEQLASLGTGPSADSLNQLFELAQSTKNFQSEETDWETPMLAVGGDLGWQLYTAANFISADVGVRVVQASIGGFDTHDGHQWRHPQLMEQMGTAIGGFLDLAEERGFADRVLVATTSEFGRRVAENDGGLDHGNASVMLVAGPIVPQRLGEPISLNDLDENDNLATTTGFDRYLGSLAQEWLGVEAASVLPGEPEPLGLM